jgi:hypothetical protein
VEGAAIVPPLLLGENLMTGIAAQAGLISPFAAPIPQNQGRRIRSPSHPFHLRSQPFVLQPFCIAPVQAGETLKNALVQSRAVLDPIGNPLIGWWLEHYLFYVKITQTAINPAFLYEPATAVGNAIAADRLGFYQKYTAGEANVDWLGACMKPIVTWYFRNDDEDESLAAGKWSTDYIAQIVGKNVFESAQIATALTNLTDVNVDLNANSAITVGEIETAWRTYQLAKANGLAAMTFDDYLVQQGVKVESERTDEQKPELLRYNREWQYPVNTVEPTTGVPSSSVSWAVTMRADKDRYFTEPGFIIGVSVARPKVYLKSQNGSMVGFVNSAADWLPKWLMDDAVSGIERVVAASNNLDNSSEIMLDLRDLWEHGEQFVGFDVDIATATYKFNAIATTDRYGVGRYPVQADVQAFFTGPTAYYARQDGVTDLKIATSLARDKLVSIDGRF